MPRETFRKAITAAEFLDLEEGLQAIKDDEGGGQIRADNSRAVLGSACIDDDCNCKGGWPNDPRWDYVVGYERGRRAIAFFIEVHSAETKAVSKMGDKLQWLMDYLERESQSELKKLPREVYWVASGRFRIPKHLGKYKVLTTTLRKRGLKGPVKSLVLT